MSSSIYPYTAPYARYIIAPAMADPVASRRGGAATATEWRSGRKMGSGRRRYRVR